MNKHHTRNIYHHCTVLKRLYKRGYPKPLVEKTIAIQKYYNRQKYLQQNRPRQPAPALPTDTPGIRNPALHVTPLHRTAPPHT